MWRLLSARLMLVQPGLQAIETTRNELESSSATWTLVPSTMPLTVLHWPASTTTLIGACVPTVTSNVNQKSWVMAVTADLQSLTLMRFVSFVNVTDFSTPRAVVMSTLTPARSMLLQLGLQATETMRNELESSSATWTLVPSTMPLTVLHWPASTTTLIGACVPTVTSN